jgi:hypothetical protein
MPPQQPYGLLDVVFQSLRFGAHAALGFLSEMDATRGVSARRGEM